MAFGGLKDSLGTVFDKGVNELGSKLASAAGGANPEGKASGAASFCSHCGEKLEPSARFCPGCGQRIASTAPEAQVAAPSHSMPSIPGFASEGRKSVYEGAIHKCPSCGSPIAPTDAVCAECGHQIAERAVSGAVQQFAEQMMEIEQSRGTLNALMSGVLKSGANSVDSRKITLIKTFPIPNTVEELSEFMYLAVSNIDVKLSKKALFAAQASPAKDISDAWVAKMQQIYQKAERSFPSDPVFAQIKSLYEEKMTELKMNVR